jgi:hypothetical protein
MTVTLTLSMVKVLPVGTIALPVKTVNESNDKVLAVSPVVVPDWVNPLIVVEMNA